jgi:hypothetical protein
MREADNVARLCAAVHLQPSEYHKLTLRERDAFIRTATEQSKG